MVLDFGSRFVVAGALSKEISSEKDVRWQIEALSWGGSGTVVRTSKSRLLGLEQQRQLLYCARFMTLFHVNI